MLRSLVPFLVLSLQYLFGNQWLGGQSLSAAMMRFYQGEATWKPYSDYQNTLCSESEKPCDMRITETLLRWSFPSHSHLSHKNQKDLALIIWPEDDYNGAFSVAKVASTAQVEKPIGYVANVSST